MTRRLVLLLGAVLLFVTFPALARRRGVMPGAPSHCVRGVIAKDGAPFVMATDATHVYWVDDHIGSVHRAPLHGGAVQDLGVTLGGFQPWAMAVDDTKIYFGVSAIADGTNAGSIQVMPKTGGPLATLVPAVLTPVDVEVDGGYLYWAAAGTLDFENGNVAADGKIERAKTDGTGRQTLAENLSAPTDVELEGNFVWYGETGSGGNDPTVGVYRVPKTGGAVETINASVAASQLALTADSVVVEGSTASVDWGLVRVARSGGAVTPVVANDDVYGRPTIFDGDIYYVTNADAASLWVVPLDGSAAPRLLRNDLFYATGEVFIDDCAITVGLENGDIERIGY